MVQTSRLRALRIILLLLATLIAVPASLVIRRIFFPPRAIPQQAPVPQGQQPPRDTGDAGKERGLLRVE